MKTAVDETTDHPKSRFQAALMKALSASSDRYPTVRCWSQKHLKRLLSQLRTDLLDKKMLTHSFPRSEALLNWIQESGLGVQLAVTPGPTSKKETAFYLLEVGASDRSIVSPYELLQAHQPAGVICYFAALSFHNLTTQTPPFYHSAALTARPVITGKSTAPSPNENEGEPAATRNPLGSLSFIYGDAHYYSTKRYSDRVLGAQWQMIDQRIRLQVTNIEQTLLDTLSHSEASGGQAVIFEAWDQGWDRSNPEILCRYLRAMGVPLTRRFGAMCNLLELQVSAEIAAYLDPLRGTFANERTINLLRGNQGARIDTDWNVAIPE